MEFKIPETLNEEHEELHRELARITEVGGAIGEAAKKVAIIMHPHFIMEEEYAMPPLGLLEPLSKGDIKPEMKAVLKITDHLKEMLPQMLSEHQAIVEALIKLADVSTRENRMEFAFIAICLYCEKTYHTYKDRGGGFVSGGNSGWRVP